MILPTETLLGARGKPMRSRCAKLRAAVRDQIIIEATLKSPIAVEILAASLAELVVSMRLLGEKQDRGLAPTDEIRTLPGLAGNIKRTLAELGVMEPAAPDLGDL